VKKTLTLVLAAIAVGVFLTAFARPTARVFTLTLSDRQLNELMYIIDRSSAEHTTVTAVQKAIYSQVEAQIQAQ
jgi:hypothetical protein